MRPHTALILWLAAATPVALMGPPPCRAAPGARLTLSACELHQPQGLTLTQARCGQLTVPENPADPHGRRIELRVAVVPAVSTRKRPDPLFVLAGGPGMAATDFYASVAPVFEPIRRDRDIVLVDQRGTGGSNALNCELGEEDLYETTTADILAQARRCLRSLGAHAGARRRQDQFVRILLRHH